MRRLLVLCIALAVVSAAPLAAQAQSGGTETGFYLGRFSATAISVAYELLYLQSLIDEVKPAEMTDEALRAGKVTEQDVQMAQHALVYAVWRMQFFIDPMIEDADSPDSFAHPALADMADPTRAVLGKVKAERDAFMDAADLPALATLGQALKDGGYASQLMDLAKQAADKAGVGGDAGDTAPAKT